MRRFLSLWLFLCAILQVAAQIPNGYYTAANGSKGSGLKTSLSAIISDHTVESYKDLWEDFTETDAREDGRVWDMYSSTTGFMFISDQCGNYKNEGDCYNREHSFPKSWFNDASPMYTDLFHLYPTDGYVNNRRSNYPFGETDRPTYTSNDGFSRLGPSSVSGYSGTVFEPADEYKGDFARTYFYMVTCYENRISGWNSDMLDGKSYPGFARWALDMLLRWSEEDPISEKEIRRNNAVYHIQGNRNPYIDFPGLEQYVWGDKTDSAFDPAHYEEGNETTIPDVAAPIFSPTAGKVTAGTVVTLDCETPGAYIVYSVNGEGLRTEEPPVYLTVNSPTTIEAYAIKDDKISERVSAAYILTGTASEEEVQTFRKVISETDLRPGSRYLIVCESENQAMGAADNDIRSNVPIQLNEDKLQTKTGKDGLPFQVELGGTSGAYTLYDIAAKTYLSLNSDENKLYATSTPNSENALWSITLEGDGIRIENCAYPNRSIRYNTSAPRFVCYKSGQAPVTLYLNTTTGTVISPVSAIEENSLVDVHTLDGILIRQNVPANQALNQLKKGVYIINKRKFVKQ